MNDSESDRIAQLVAEVRRLRAVFSTARRDALEEAAREVRALRGRDVQASAALDAGEGYDLAILEALECIRTLKEKPDA